jgi:hypothetical protein
LDQAQFFQQHAENVFDVIYKSFMGQVDKIKREKINFIILIKDIKIFILKRFIIYVIQKNQNVLCHFHQKNL